MRKSPIIKPMKKNRTFLKSDTPPYLRLKWLQSQPTTKLNQRIRIAEL
jgi:hypothetical protein